MDLSKKEDNNEEKKSSISLSKIVLEKKGDSAKISLDKSTSSISNIGVKLNWTKAVDFDLYAFYKTKKGVFDKVYFGNKGELKRPPYILLDQDAGIGNTAGDNEENIAIGTLKEVDYILIAVNIFKFFGFLSSGENFAKYDGRVTVKTNSDNEIVVPLTSDEKGKWCVIAKIDNTNEDEPKVININQVLKSEPKITDF